MFFDDLKKERLLSAGQSDFFGLIGWLFLFVVIVCFNIFGGFFVYREVVSELWLFPGVIGLSLFRNYAFAFSVPLPVWIIYSVYGVIFCGIVFYLNVQWKTLSRVQRLMWVLVLAGGVSNVLERLFLGYVRDFIYIYGGAILNLADLEIFLGVILLLLWEAWHYRKAGL